MYRVPSIARLKLSASELEIGSISFGRQSLEYLKCKQRALNVTIVTTLHLFFSHATETETGTTIATATE